MSIRTRRPRAFRPVSVALEARNAVSSLDLTLVPSVLSDLPSLQVAPAPPEACDASPSIAFAVPVTATVTASVPAVATSAGSSDVAVALATDTSESQVDVITPLGAVPSTLPDPMTSSEITVSVTFNPSNSASGGSGQAITAGVGSSGASPMPARGNIRPLSLPAQPATSPAVTDGSAAPTVGETTDSAAAAPVADLGTQDATTSPQATTLLVFRGDQLISPTSSPDSMATKSAMAATSSPTMATKSAMTATSSPTVDAVIGGTGSIALWPLANEQITSITWKIDGAMLNPQAPADTQHYKWALGTTAKLPNPYTVQVSPPSSNMQSLSFYWNEVVGVHNISYTYNYNKVVGGTVVGTGVATLQTPIARNIGKPRVISFQDQYRPLEFGRYTSAQNGSDLTGFHQGNGYGTPGQIFTATLDTSGLPTGGSFAVLEKVSYNLTVTIPNVPQQRASTMGNNPTDPELDFVLDNPPDAVDPHGAETIDAMFCIHYISPAYGANVNSIAIPEYNPYYPSMNQSIVDSPYWAQLTVNNATQYGMEMHYHSYLMYKSPYGLWVSLSMLSLDLAGQAVLRNGVWTNPANPPDPDLPPLLPIVERPANGGTAVGADRNEFVRWNEWYTKQIRGW